MLRATLDLGSNSFLLLIGEFDQAGKFEERESLAEITALGDGLGETGRFSEEACARGFKVLTEYRKKILEWGIPLSEVIATATEAARVAANADHFFLRVEKELGIKVTILSGEGEAYYAAKGVTLGLLNLNKEGPTKNQDLILMDLGGASTEFIRVQTFPFKILDSISLPLGVVRGKDWAKVNQFEEKFQKLLQENKEELLKYKCDKIIAMAGTVTALATMYLNRKVYQDKAVQGLLLNFEKFESWAQEILAGLPGDEATLIKNFPFLQKRSQTIGVGAKIILGLGKLLGIQDLWVSTFGLRHGTLFEGSIKDEFIFRPRERER